MPSKRGYRKLRADIVEHLNSIGCSTLANGVNAFEGALESKAQIRLAHAEQRGEFLRREANACGAEWPELIRNYFANGNEIVPRKIMPYLQRVNSSQVTGKIFRLATALWSIPVSRGFGRRLRYLVIDESTRKLMGVFALGDPVFNLSARDEWIGWKGSDREKRLVNVMDAYVLGAVPPYAALLGGKLVASLVGSAEVSRDFARYYGNKRGVISHENKRAKLALVTTTSALGPSSLYNRLHLRSMPDPFDPNAATLVRIERIGSTKGYGHFHLSEALFNQLRELLARQQHEYVNGHAFGDGPNWRLRVLRVGLREIGMDPELIRHGIRREVYAMPLGTNTIEYLRGVRKRVHIKRPKAEAISEAALARWVLPRAERNPEFTSVRREEYFEEQLGLVSEA